MSLAATTKAYACRPDGPTAKLVLIRFADFADDDGRADIDQRDLCDFAMCDETTLWHSIARLEIDGFLTTDKESFVVLFGSAA